MKYPKKGNQLRQVMKFKLVDLVKDDTHKSNQCDNNNGAALLSPFLPPISWIKSMLCCTISSFIDGSPSVPIPYWNQ